MSAETPQTTRCQCGHALHFHSAITCYGAHRERTFCGCPKSVPAPSAPARAGEPDEERKARNEIIDAVQDFRFGVSDLGRVDDALYAYERVILSRALAPSRAGESTDAEYDDAIHAVCAMFPGFHSPQSSEWPNQRATLQKLLDLHARRALAPATAAQEAHKPWGWVYSDNGCDFTLLWDDALIAELREAGKTVLPLYAAPVAPATAEPTAEMVEEGAKLAYAAMQMVSREGQQKPWVEGGNSLAQDEARRAARAILRAALSRGSGPVGQASEPVEWQYRYRDNDGKGNPSKWMSSEGHDDSLKWMRDHPDRYELRALYTVPIAVAASAEAKRIEITEAMVERGFQAATYAGDQFGTPTQVPRDVVERILTAAHASPESGV